jgi:hypothetical protein
LENSRSILTQRKTKLYAADLIEEMTGAWNQLHEVIYDLYSSPTAITSKIKDDDDDGGGGGGGSGKQHS